MKSKNYLAITQSWSMGFCIWHKLLCHHICIQGNYTWLKLDHSDSNQVSMKCTSTSYIASLPVYGTKPSIDDLRFPSSFSLDGGYILRMDETMTWAS